MDNTARRTAAPTLPIKLAPSHCVFYGILAAFCFGLLPALSAAQPSYPRIIGSGEDRTVDYGPSPRGNIVGGGQVAVSGGGEDTALIRHGPPVTQSPRIGMMPVVVAGGEHATTAWVPVDIDRLRQTLIGGDGSLPEMVPPGTSIQSASRVVEPRM